CLRFRSCPRVGEDGQSIWLDGSPNPVRDAAAAESRQRTGKETAMRRAGEARKVNGRKTVRAHERPTRRRLAAALGHMLGALGIPAQGRKRAAAEVDRFHAAKSSAS